MASPRAPNHRRITMSDIRDVVPTRSALLELKQEQSFVRDGHEFLDQKRLLLASESLRCLAELDAVQRELKRASERARNTLAKAVARHGLEELSVHPVAETEFRLEARTRDFLGLPLQ